MTAKRTPIPEVTMAFGAALLVALIAMTTPLAAAEDRNAGLFINLSSVDAVPAGHALQFAGKMHDRGHPTVVFLNGKAVWIAAKGAPQFTYPETGQTLQAMLKSLLTQGVDVIVCQVCAKLHGVTRDDVIEGAPLGSPDLVSRHLFDPATKVISW